MAHAPEITPLLPPRAWEPAPRVLHAPETTPLLLHRAWEPAPRAHLAPAAFHAPWLLAQVACLVPAVPVALAVPVAQVVPVVLALASSAQAVLVEVSATRNGTT